MRLVVVVLLATGCRFGFFEHDDARGDSPGDSFANDVDINVQLGPWGPPVPVAELNDPLLQDDDPTLTSDLLEIFIDTELAVGGGANGDVWVATRASTSDAFGTLSPITPLLSNFDDTTFDLTPDGLTMYFGSDRFTPGDRDLFVTTRPNRQSQWSAPTIVPELSSFGYHDSGICESADGLTIIFSSERTGVGDMFESKRSTRTSPWGLPAPLANLDAASLEEDQHWCNDDLTLVYFTRTSGTQLDIYMTSRASPDATFDPPQPVTELNTSSDDTDPWLSPDLRTMYFFSKRAGGGDIYMTTR